MSIEKPFALHITWTCYATRLPGDERGYVSNTLLPGGGYVPKQNTPGTPCTADDAYTRERARSLQKSPTVFLTPDQALVAAQALVKAAKTRSWRIVRGALMCNHVHVVVMDCPDDGPAVRRILKGNSHAALSEHERAAAITPEQRAAGFTPAGQGHRWWTAGGSDRYKHDWAAIETAVNYVADQPGMLVEIIDMEVRVVGPK
jgi:REP element-mobilizing transposase RayT